ncbi:MAG: ATP-binding protein [Defluviitaleaceae bacterium]|nr:ATP-binding protein [Defluviitaleaceae bacterium]
MFEYIVIAVLFAAACAAIIFAVHTHKKSGKRAEVYDSASFIFEAVPLVLTLWSPAGKIIDCNLEAVRRFGLSCKNDYIERTFELIPENQPPGYMSIRWCFQLLSNVRDDRQLIINVMHYNLSGGQIPMEVSFYKTTYKGKPVILTCASDMRGVYESMQREQQATERSAQIEAHSQAKSRFFARMSHELRTPLTAVHGISEILLQRPDTHADIEEAMAKIHNSSTSLIRIVNDILDLSKIEAGQLSIVREVYEPANLISDIVQTNIILLADKPVNFVVTADETLPCRLIGDEIRIRQVIINVLSNAFKYTDSGEILFSVHCFKTSPDNVNLMVMIKDTGRGMNRKQLDTLFKEYTRFHEDDDRFTEGTGLGMPIVYNLLNLMSGDIDIESYVGQGTTIIINIPQQVPDSEVIGAETAKRLEQFEIGLQKKSSFEPKPMPGGRVLVVDDVETNRYVARGLLSFYELDVETCCNGAEAVEKIREGNVYDIIFMDRMMPELNGIEATKILRETGYTNPIVALTANAIKTEEFSGFDDFVAKPIQSSELDAVLKKFIKHDKSAPEDYYSRPEVREMIRLDFAENHSNAVAEIKAALAVGDTETAQRIAHTVKSLARYMKEDAAASAAAAAESAMLDPNPDAAIANLEAELKKLM